MKKKLLVIGGTGFLGSHICKEAVKKNYEVKSVSTQKTKFTKIKKVKYIKCDISKFAQIKKRLNFDVDYVVNFGGYVDHSNKKKTYDSHFKGCKNLIDFYKKKKIIKFIQVGSSLEYGKMRSPHKEKYFFKKNSNLKSVYAKSKLMSTKYCIESFKKFSFPVTILRPYLVYGPGQKTNRLIPHTISKSLKNKKFPCSAGTQTRNFLYVEDFVKAIFKTLISKNVNGEIINIGSDKNQKVKKVILMIKYYLKSGKPTFGKIRLRKDESMSYYPDIKKAKNLINWKPLMKFEKGLVQTIKFYSRKS